MRVWLPATCDVRAVQARERAYYYSAAFEVVCRKRGYPVLDARDAGSGGFVTRGAPWAEEYAPLPIVFEGPLAPSVVATAGIRVREHEVEKLDVHVTGSAGPLVTLAYKRTTARKIPPKNGIVSEPFPFVCADPYWNPGPVRFQSFEPAPGLEPCLTARTVSGDELVVGVRRGTHLFLGVPLLDVLAQCHSFPPYADAGFYDMIVDPATDGAERWLFAELAELYRAAGAGLLRLATWPAPFRAALSVRHDYDRPIPDKVLARLLRFYRAQGVKSTWYWRLSVGTAAQARTIRAAGHEVSLHTEVPTADRFAGEELAFFHRTLGVRPAGYSAHGGSGAVGYLGLTQLRWAMAHQLAYGEKLGGAAPLPHQAIDIVDGIPVAADLPLSSKHRSLDVGTKPDAHCRDHVLTVAGEALAAGDHAVVMNHPDIHLPQLREVLTGLDRRGVWSATLAEVCAWFKNVHGSSRLVLAGGRYHLYFPRPLSHPAVVEINHQTATVPAGVESLSVPAAGGGAVSVFPPVPVSPGSVFRFARRRVDELPLRPAA